MYIKNIDLNNINLTKDYNFIKQNNIFENINKVDEKIEVYDLEFKKELVEDKHFSKSIHKTLTKDEMTNIEFGKKIHSILENIDFKNPNYDGLTNYEKRKAEKLINNDIFKNCINIFKEYEFIYTVKDAEYHGIIDLLIEYPNEFKIIDYKLKNILDDAYLNQLNGYKKYIESLSDKPVSIYLYSIIDEKLKKL